MLRSEVSITKIIGITGPTGAGKATALQALVELDAHIIDADAVYHALLESSATLRAELAEGLERYFGAKTAVGLVDRDNCVFEAEL